ncbi:MAG: LysE family translocator [Candidatus Berkiellales bacterium]
MISLLIKGFLIGFSIAAPVGPIGILCINRTLAAGIMVGILTGLGAAVADAIYGCIAGFGLVAVTKFLLAQQTIIKTIGGVFLLYLGTKTLLAAPRTNNTVTDHAKTPWQDFSSTLFLTLTNPATIIAFIAIYASLGIVEPNTNFTEALVIVFGVFMGSLMWWCFLSGSIHLIRHKLNESVLVWINRLSGVILICFGLFATLSF